MKRFAAVIPFIAVLLSGTISCRKDNPESDYFSFQSDNVMYTFDSIRVEVDTNRGETNTYIYALNTGTTSYVTMSLESPYKITGQYDNKNNTDPTSFSLYQFSYYIWNSATGYMLFVMKSSPFRLNLEQSSGNTMRIHGTFSGTIAQYDGTPSLKLTDGKFDLPFSYR